MDTTGRHVIAELDGCDPPMLRNREQIRRLLIEAAETAGATILTDNFFSFNNGGVSGFVLLAESHISIHTWPEHRYAAIDIYTCGDHAVPERACSYLTERLHAIQSRLSVLERGLSASEGGHMHRLAVKSAKGFPRIAAVSQGA
jgi:S-adenosylmethionine decarboxylase